MNSHGADNAHEWLPTRRKVEGEVTLRGFEAVSPMVPIRESPRHSGLRPA